MNDSAFDPDPMELLAQYIDGTISEQDAEILHEIMEKNPESAQKMFRAVHVDLLLRDHYNLIHTNLAENEIETALPDYEDLVYLEKNSPFQNKIRSNDSGEIMPSPRPEGHHKTADQKVSSPRQEGYLLANWCLGILILLFGWGIYREFVPLPMEDTRFNSVARIVECIDVQWEENSESFKPGQEIEPSSLRLKQGVVKLEFGCGAEVVLEGPSELLVKQKDSAFFHNGRLSAYVPPSGIGFEITSPLVSVVDLGTAFSMQVSPEKSDVHVLNGKIELKPSSKQKQLLSEGFAALLDFRKETRFVKADPTTFFNDQKIQQQKTKYIAKRKEVWEEQSQQLYSDPALVYSLDPEKTTGLCRVPGSREGVRALCFRNTRERLNVELQTTTQSLTLMAVVRLEKFHNAANSLLMSENFYETPGALNWQMNRFGMLQFHICEDHSPLRFDSDPVFKHGDCKTWTFLAVVADAERKKIVHYLDGRPVATVVWPKPQPLSLDSICIGNVPASEINKKRGRFFDGDIENFWIFSRPYSTVEIREFYENNR